MSSAQIIQVILRARGIVTFGKFCKRFFFFLSVSPLTSLDENYKGLTSLDAYLLFATVYLKI